jgi:hypothetical protein
MKPPIEYRPKPKTKPKGGRSNTQSVRRRRAEDNAQPQAKAVEPTSGADFIVIRRNRAKYNEYMRDYRRRQKLKKKKP